MKQERSEVPPLNIEKLIKAVKMAKEAGLFDPVPDGFAVRPPKHCSTSKAFSDNGNLLFTIDRVAVQ